MILLPFSATSSCPSTQGSLCSTLSAPINPAMGPCHFFYERMFPKSVSDAVLRCVPESQAPLMCSHIEGPRPDPACERPLAGAKVWCNVLSRSTELLVWNYGANWLDELSPLPMDKWKSVQLSVGKPWISMACSAKGWIIFLRKIPWNSQELNLETFGLWKRRGFK